MVCSLRVLGDPIKLVWKLLAQLVAELMVSSVGISRLLSSMRSIQRVLGAELSSNPEIRR